MSLYNMAAGYDPTAAAVLHALDFASSEELPRFRDAYVDVDNSYGRTTLVVMTRTGGGNRADYVEQNDALRARPGFLEDFDDEFDSTFAHWRYDVPENMQEEAVELVAFLRAEGWTFPKPMERFKAVIEGMKGESK